MFAQLNTLSFQLSFFIDYKNLSWKRKLLLLFWLFSMLLNLQHSPHILSSIPNNRTNWHLTLLSKQIPSSPNIQIMALIISLLTSSNLQKNISFTYPKSSFHILNTHSQIHYLCQPLTSWDQHNIHLFLSFVVKFDSIISYRKNCQTLNSIWEDFKV